MTTRQDEIRSAYRNLGKGASFYDGMITCSSPTGKLICKLVWNMDQKDNDEYLSLAMDGIPEGFASSLLEVPVGTGVLSMPLYKSLPDAAVTCLDYSESMMEAARQRARAAGLSNVRFEQGDAGHLPFADASFDCVLSLNGFHAFPDKEAAFQEVCRVLKPGGIFCGCFYIQGKNARTDWFIEHLYKPKGFFTPPFETADSLFDRLQRQYETVQMQTIESIACFTCRKAAATVSKDAAERTDRTGIKADPAITGTKADPADTQEDGEEILLQKDLENKTGRKETSYE